MGWFLRVGNWAVAKLIQILHAGPSLTDCGCTLRLIRRSALEQIGDRFTVGGSHFLPEMVILALKGGLRVIEVPVNYRGRVGESKITGTLKGALRHGRPHDRTRLQVSRHLKTQRGSSYVLVVLAAALPYFPTLDDYFVQDDFGVVWLLSAKPAGYFPRWFVSPWMDDIWGDPPDEIRPFPAVTYQVAALWGAASPVANHVINIALSCGQCAARVPDRRDSGRLVARPGGVRGARVRHSADADRIGGLGHRARRFDARVLLPCVVPALCPLACPSPAVSLRLVGGGLLRRAVYQAEHGDAASRSFAVRRDCCETSGASVMELAAALRAVRAADGRIPRSALCALRRSRA